MPKPAPEICMHVQLGCWGAVGDWTFVPRHAKRLADWTVQELLGLYSTRRLGLFISGVAKRCH